MTKSLLHICCSGWQKHV